MVDEEQCAFPGYVRPHLAKKGSRELSALVAICHGKRIDLGCASGMHEIRRSPLNLQTLLENQWKQSLPTCSTEEQYDS